MNELTRIEVTDLYRKVYEIVAMIWSEPCFRGQAREDKYVPGAFWFDVDVFIEDQLFFAGCCRRVHQLTGKYVRQDDIAGALRVCDSSGNERQGDAGYYWSTGFDSGSPDADEIQPTVVARDAGEYRIDETRLFVRLSELPDVTESDKIPDWYRDPDD